jgi:hypothetical protein
MTRFARALVVSGLIAPILAFSWTADASPRRAEADGESASILAQLWDRVSSLWGAGGAGMDPSGVVRTPPAPIAGSAAAAPAAAEGSGRVRSEPAST